MILWKDRFEMAHWGNALTELYFWLGQLGRAVADSGQNEANSDSFRLFNPVRFELDSHKKWVVCIARWKTKARACTAAWGLHLSTSSDLKELHTFQYLGGKRGKPNFRSSVHITSLLVLLVPKIVLESLKCFSAFLCWHFCKGSGPWLGLCCCCTSSVHWTIG
jgi:hypothetical protein